MADEKLNKAAKALSDLGASKGGIARAKALSREQRQAIGRAAIEARWNKAGKLGRLVQATHGSPDSPLRIGSVEIPCYVLEDGRRVLAQKGMITALGMTPGGSSHGQDRIVKFATQDRLKPFTSEKLKPGTLMPIEFRTPDGRRMLGYEATLLADMCDAVLEARRRGSLTEKQQHVATQCEILVRGFARVGIIALVDEATGYQADRARDALAKILESFVAKELRKWVRTFPSEFYRELFRLRGLPYDGSIKKPQYIGHLTNDLVYSRLAPGVLDELRRLTPRNEKGQLKHKLFQRLTEDIGHPKLREHLASVTTLMRAADKWEQFTDMIDRALPRYVALPLFEGKEEKPLELT
jgi:P63C domain